MLNNSPRRRARLLESMQRDAAFGHGGITTQSRAFDASAADGRRVYPSSRSTDQARRDLEILEREGSLQRGRFPGEWELR